MDSLQRLRRYRKKALIIIAHPDDETLFMGGTIASFKRWNWTILCISDCDIRYNRRRREELMRVCRLYGAEGHSVRPHMLGITKENGSISVQKIEMAIRRFLNAFGPFDLFFTHNRIGEYGHKTHILVHKAVKNLHLKNVFFFSLSSGGFPSNLLPGCSQTVFFGADGLRLKRKALLVYSEGSQRTNLSRLKGVVEVAKKTTCESFLTDN